MNLGKCLFVALIICCLTACGVQNTASRPAPVLSDAQPIPSQVTAVATTSRAGTVELQVFAAASLTEAFTELGTAFDALNHTKTVFNFAGSQQLAQQITQGAPADVFASANRVQMDKVIQAGDIITGTQRTFARNRLVVVYPKANRAGLTQLQDLTKPGVKLVLAAKEVPVGQYALDMLAKAAGSPTYSAAFQAAVLKNVVSYEENVRAVLTKVALGEADAGIVYSSDISPATSDKVGRIAVPDALNTLASYPIAPVSKAAHAAQAEAFIAYVLSPAGQQVLASYGFITAADQTSSGRMTEPARALSQSAGNQ